MKLPEYEGPPDLYYDEENARKYNKNTRIINIQRELSQRCIDLLELNEKGLIVDLGCGSGWSGSVISENGHLWIGLDVSKGMLDICNSRNQNLDLLKIDMGENLPFSPGAFDGAISVSSVQWLFHSYSSNQNPLHRIKTFFKNLFSLLKRGSRAVIQFYPESEKQIEILKTEAKKAGFNGGLVIDDEKSKNIKHFLVLECGTNSLNVSKNDKNKKNKKKIETNRDIILRKKARMRAKGIEVRPDSKYTGRKRKRRF